MRKGIGVMIYKDNITVDDGVRVKLLLWNGTFPSDVSDELNISIQDIDKIWKGILVPSSTWPDGSDNGISSERIDILLSLSYQNPLHLFL